MKLSKPLIKKLLLGVLTGVALLNVLSVFLAAPVSAQTTVPKYPIPLGCPGSTIQGPASPAQLAECAKIPIGCPGSTQQGPPSGGFVINNCPYGSPGSPVAAPGTLTTTPKPAIPIGCPGSTVQGPASPAQLAACGNIPIGCPGSTQVGPPGGGFNINNCPYASPGSPVGTATPAPTPPAGSTEEGGNNLECERGTNFSLAWIACPIVQGLANGADALYNNYIVPQLKTQPVRIDSGDRIFKIWSRIRVFANVLLIGGLMVVIFAQATGGGMIDAYTAKKVLPRIFIAGILINLSVYLVAALVDVTNIAGQGLDTIFTDVLGADNAKFGLNGIGSAGLIAGLSAAVFAAAIGWQFVLMFILLPAFLAFLSVVLMLMIRQGVIVALIVISPMAFAMYCLPNTEGLFKKWWKALSAALMIYPATALVFGVSRLLALTVQFGNQGDVTGARDAAGSIGTLIFLVGPLFGVYWVSRKMDQAIGGVMQMGDKWRERGLQTVQGDPKDPESRGNKARRAFSHGMNERNLSGAALAARLNPRTMVGEQGRALRQGQLTAIRETNAQKLGQQATQGFTFEANKDDDKVMTDLGLYGSSGESRAAIGHWHRKQNAEQDAVAAKANDSFAKGRITESERDEVLSGVAQQRTEIEHGRQQKLLASAKADRIGRSRENRRQALMQGSTIGYGLDAGEEGWTQAVAAMRELSGAQVNYQYNDKGELETGENGEVKYSGGNEAEFRNMVNQFQYVAKNVGRSDLSGNTDSDGYNGYRAWTSVDLYTKGKGKPADIKGSGKYFTGLIERVNSNQLNSMDRKNFDKDARARGVSVEAMAAEAAASFYLEQGQLAQNASGGVRDEAVRQQRAMAEALGSLSQKVASELNPSMISRQNPNGTVSMLSPAERIINAPSTRNKARTYDNPDRVRQMNDAA